MSILKKLLQIDDKGRVFMKTPDKVDTKAVLQDGVDRYCPPHKWPHVLPWQKPVTDEPCHIHTTNWRQYGHHEPFCKLLRCPNYEAMCKAKREYKESPKKD